MSRALHARPIGRPVASSTASRFAWSVGRATPVVAPTVPLFARNSSSSLGRRDRAVADPTSGAFIWEPCQCVGGSRPLAWGLSSAPTPLRAQSVVPTVSGPGGRS